MTSLGGISDRARAPVLSMIPGDEAPGKASLTGSEPVAIRTASTFICRWVPSGIEAITVPRFSNLPRPNTVSTRRDLSSDSTPAVIFLTIFSLRPWTPLQSKPFVSMFRPKDWAWDNF